MSLATAPQISTANPARRARAVFPALVVSTLALMLAQRAFMTGVSSGPLRVDLFLGVDAIWCLAWLPLAPVVFWTARRGLSSPSMHRAIAIHLVAAAVIIAAQATLSGVVTGVLAGIDADFLLLQRSLLALGWRLLPDSLVYALIVAITVAREHAGGLRVREPIDAPTRKPGPSIAFADGERTIVFEAVEISWICASKDYAQVHARGRTWLVREPLDSLERRLPGPPFHRTHRSAIVNLRHVTQVERSGRYRHVALLRDGTRVPVSASRRASVDARLLG
jgi:DNA-binding LytR/AlgR family response regulator